MSPAVEAPAELAPQVTVLVHGLALEAEIGLNPGEAGRRQPLIVDVEAQVEGEPWRGLSHTLDYDRIVAHARRLLAAGHIGLVEAFALRLARAVMGEPHVVAVMVRVLKPEALAGAARAGGVEVRLGAR
jgi:dihydroneopterin aldolase